MKSRGWEPILSLSILLVPLSLGAQSFEGVMTQRSIELDDQAVFELMERVMPMEEEPDLDSEEAWFRYTAEKLFEASFEESPALVVIFSATRSSIPCLTSWISAAHSALSTCSLICISRSLIP